MAIYHLNSKVVSRAKGQTAANSLAYEAGQKLNSIDGRELDFSSKEVLANYIIGTTDNLQKLADKMELAENRKNSTVARRMTIALPDELTPQERNETAKEFGEWMNQEYGLAVVVSVHAPDRGGDQKNHHAHLTMSDRKIDLEGNFGAKARELTSRENGRAKKELKKIRESWAGIANDALKRAGHSERIDHRSNEERKILARPTEHLGKAKTEILRKKKGYYVTKAGANQLIKEDNEPTYKQPMETPQQGGKRIYEEKSDLQSRGNGRNEKRLGSNEEESRERGFPNQEAKGRGSSREGTSPTLREIFIREQREIIEFNKQALRRGGGDHLERSPADPRKLPTGVYLDFCDKLRNKLLSMRNKLVKPLIEKIPKEIKRKNSNRYWGDNVVRRLGELAKKIKEGKMDISEKYEYPEAKKRSQGFER